MARPPKPPICDLEGAIGHNFADPELLRRALTHVSAVPADTARSETYQRLEFLGDRVLGLAVCDMLCTAFPDAAEGELSRRLADLVRKESCAEVAIDWGVGVHLRLGEGEAQTGGRRKTAILGDVCEAIIGAVYLDAGFEVARDVVVRAWTARMNAPKRPLRDAKTALQEWAQARGRPTPLYREVSRSGPAHAPVFVIGVEIDGFEPAEASGHSKRIAEQAAAEAFMIREGVWADREKAQAK
ncbi:MAG: ribonuclease [Hyphomicrobiales bacterium]|nr:ribonuclease [Hyphomicrobiales bacterium]